VNVALLRSRDAADDRSKLSNANVIVSDSLPYKLFSDNLQHPDRRRAWGHIERLNGPFSILANPRRAELAQQALLAPDLSRRNAIKTLSLLLCAGGAGYLFQQPQR